MSWAEEWGGGLFERGALSTGTNHLSHAEPFFALPELQLYENHADGKAIGLKRPLLSSSISSSFAFAKCHYETNVPHDPFAAQLLRTERFPRFARLWTRGYDVYTPAVNIVYRDETELHPLHGSRLGHGEDGERHWPRNDAERRGSHVRMKVLLVSILDYACLSCAILF